MADPSAKKMVLYMAYHNKILAMDQTGQKSKQVRRKIKCKQTADDDDDEIYVQFLRIYINL